MNPIQRSNRVLGALALLAASLLFASCKSRVEKEIAGQVFTNHPKTGVVKQPGVLVYFLTAQQNEHFLLRVGEWRTNNLAVLQKAENDYARITNQIASSGIVRTPGVMTGGGYYLIPALQPYTNRLAHSGEAIEAFLAKDGIDALIELCQEKPLLLENLEVAEVYFEFVLYKVRMRVGFDRDKIEAELPPFDDASVKPFLRELRSSSTDANGDFSVVLTLGQEYWVLATTQKPPNRTWFFRYVPDGTRLVLSDGNAD